MVSVEHSKQIKASNVVETLKKGLKVFGYMYKLDTRGSLE